MTSTGPSSRGGVRGKNIAESQMAQKKSETKVGKPYNFLDETDIGYSFLIQPVYTSFEKFSSELRDLIGIGGEATQPASNEDQTAEEKKAEEVKRKAEVNNIANKLHDFSAKLISRESVMTAAYIQLPLPTQIPRDQLSVSYAIDDLGGSIAGYTLGSEVSESFGEGGSLSRLGGALQSGFSYALRSVLQQVLPKGVSTAFFGNIPNPFSANIFENVDPRTFTFDWVFQPKSKTEAESLREIINLLRYYSLPKPDNLLLKLPHEFNLAFLGTDFLYEFSRCVISNIEVNYAPNGFNVFTTADAPQSVALSITFKEIFTLNKDVIMNSAGKSMKPNQRKLFGETADAPQSDKAVEIPVATAQSEIEKQINQKVADWRAKDHELNKLSDQLNNQVGFGEANFAIRARIEANINAIKTNLNTIKAEVDVLQAKINYTDRTGRKLKPLPSR